MDAHIDTLVSEQASFVLNRANLAQVYGTIQQHQPKQVYIKDPLVEAYLLARCPY